MVSHDEVGARRVELMNAEVARLEDHAAGLIDQYAMALSFAKYEFEKKPFTFDIDKYFTNKQLQPPNGRLHLTILNKNGEDIDPSARKKGMFFSDRDYFSVHLAKSNVGLYIGTPIIGRLLRRWIVTMSRRLNDQNGDFAGVVYLSFDPTILVDFEASKTARESMYYYVTNHDGIIMAMNYRNVMSFGHVASYLRNDDVVSKTVSAPFVRASSMDNVDRTYVGKKLDNYPLYAYAGLNNNVAWDQYDKQSQYQIIFSTFFSVGVISLFALLIRNYYRRVRLLESRNNSSNAFSAYFARSGDAVLVFRKAHDSGFSEMDYVVEEVNNHAAEIAASMKISFIGKSLVDFYDLFMPDAFTKKVRSALENNEFFTTPAIFTSDESHTTFNFQAIPGSDCLLVILRDISEAIKQESLLDQNNRLLHAIIDNTSSMITMQSLLDDSPGQITLWNKAAEQISGYKALTIIGRRAMDTLDSKTAAPFLDVEGHMRTEGGILKLNDQKFTTRTEETISLKSTYVPIVGDDGNVHHILGISELMD